MKENNYDEIIINREKGDVVSIKQTVKIKLQAMIRKSGHCKSTNLSEKNREYVEFMKNDFNFKMYPNIECKWE